MLITLHMFSLSVVCTLNTQLKLLPFKRCTVLRQTVNGNFNLTPTVDTFVYLVLFYIQPVFVGSFILFQNVFFCTMQIYYCFVAKFFASHGNFYDENTPNYGMW